MKKDSVNALSNSELQRILSSAHCMLNILCYIPDAQSEFKTVEKVVRKIFENAEEKVTSCNLGDSNANRPFDFCQYYKQVLQYCYFSDGKFGVYKGYQNDFVYISPWKPKNRKVVEEFNTLEAELEQYYSLQKSSKSFMVKAQEDIDKRDKEFNYSLRSRKNLYLKYQISTITNKRFRAPKSLFVNNTPIYVIVDFLKKQLKEDNNTSINSMIGMISDARNVLFSWVSYRPYVFVADRQDSSEEGRISFLRFENDTAIRDAYRFKSLERLRRINDNVWLTTEKLWKEELLTAYLDPEIDETKIESDIVRGFINCVYTLQKIAKDNVLNDDNFPKFLQAVGIMKGDK